jgi:hypothetical protein
LHLAVLVVEKHDVAQGVSQTDQEIGPWRVGQRDEALVLCHHTAGKRAADVFQFPAGKIIGIQMRSPVVGERVNRRLEVMKALRAHKHLAIDLEHTRVPFWDLFRGLEISGRLRHIDESAEEATLARGWVETEDGEVLARVGTTACETDVDPFLAVHAQRVPALL